MQSLARSKYGRLIIGYFNTDLLSSYEVFSTRMINQPLVYLRHSYIYNAGLQQLIVSVAVSNHIVKRLHLLSQISNPVLLDIVIKEL